jgi:hypothetical protein
LTRVAAELEMTEDERAHVKHSLLCAMATETSPESVQDLAEAGMDLDLDPGERELFRTRALEAALAQCTRRGISWQRKRRIFESPRN